MVFEKFNEKVGKQKELCNISAGAGITRAGGRDILKTEKQYDADYR
jgi:hypothetical protein